MADPLILNASPIIVLAKAGLLGLLPSLATYVHTTRPVMDEVCAKPEDVVVMEAVRAAKWLYPINSEVYRTNIDPRLAA